MLTKNLSCYFFKLTKFSWKKIPVQIHNHSNLSTGKNGFSHIMIDTSELNDFPEAQKIATRKIFEFQNKMWEEMFKYQIKYRDDMWKIKNDEILKFQKEKEDEKINLLKENEVEIKKLLKEYEDMKINLNIQIEKLQQEVKQHIQSLLYIKYMCNIKGALDFIHTQILENKHSLFTESMDKSLQYLSQDKEFTKLLQKTCKDNNIQYDGIQKCMNSLYQTALKTFHARERKVIINAQNWSPNEVLLLGVIFHHYKIPFLYYDDDNSKAIYPYKLE
ncbi:hypothetical protein C1645_811298 [Glomus cerebriforme]|uniref:Uncharacterized protein n=1 Tax=Glomus cerebriforme TaxID=658196 RepID=A0A397TRG9_9GLOM|nr:hypothetical protein C1645_811298 [Glomus cerebriforme]